MLEPAPTGGRLGQTEYSLGPDLIVVRRSWRHALLLPGIPLAIALVAVTLWRIEPGPEEPVVPIVSTLLATVLLIAGMFGAVSVPWLRPRTIACTPAGVQIDDTTLAAAAIAEILTDTILRRSKGTTEFGLCLVIVPVVGLRTRMEVAASYEFSDSQLELIVREMRRMLSLAVDGKAPRLPGDPR